MFPRDMQERCGPRHMVIRNIEAYDVEAYDYSAARLSEDVIPPDGDDEALLQKLRGLDNEISQDYEYEDIEDLYFEVSRLCGIRFDKWLSDKNAPEHMSSLEGCLEIFISFIYAYGHDRLVTLKTMSRVELEEFFYDHLLRKMSAEPDEYAEWPAAIKFFYQFLLEKGYVEDAGTVIRAIDEIEPFFIKALKKRFG